MRNKKAFTLVELIIVIAIIAILAVSASLMLVKWIGKSKDARTLADLNTIKKAMEIQYTYKGKYPMPDNYKTVYGESGGVLWYQGTLGENAISSIDELNKVPEDQTKENPKKGYDYSVSADKKTYQVFGKLENRSMVSYNPYVGKTYASDNKYYITSVGNYKGYIVENTGDKYNLYNAASMYLLNGIKLVSGENELYVRGEIIGVKKEVKKVDISKLYDGDSSNDEEVLSGVKNKFGLDSWDIARSVVSQAANVGGIEISTSTVSVCDIFGDNSAVALYNFDGNANDKCGNYNTTIHGNLNFTNGKFDQALEYTNPSTNPNDNYVEINKDIFNNADKFTISMWIKAYNYDTSRNNVIFSNYNCSRNQVYFNISLSENKKLLFAYWDRNSQHIIQYITYNNFNLNQYYNIVFMVDKNNNTITAYVNGEKIGNLTHNAIQDSISQTPRLFGWVANCSDLNTTNFNGSIDQVRIFNRALTDSEVQQLYNEKR